MPMKPPMPVPRKVPKIVWQVEETIPGEHASLLYSPPGVGKTRLLAYLAVQTVRPAGRGTFAGRAVRHGRVVILDADDPSGTGYAIWINRFLATYGDADRDLIEIRPVEGGLEKADIAILAGELEHDPPALLIVDSFAAAFPGVNMIMPHAVQEPMHALAVLAVNIKTCLMLIDHTGKLAPGQSVAEKGAVGAGQKLAAMRAAFALERVPPRDCGGLDVLKLEPTKSNYARMHEPIGLEFRIGSDGQSASVHLYELPSDDKLEDRASDKIRKLIEDAGEEGIRRSELVDQVVNRANVSRRTVERALKDVLKDDAIEEIRLKVKGAPKVLRYKPDPAERQGEDGTESDTANGQDVPLDLPDLEAKPMPEPAIPRPLALLARNAKNAVPDGESFLANPLASNQGLARNGEESAMLEAEL
jgi:hypothetical protein